MGKASRDKGKRWERAVARMLRPIFGETQVRRGLQSRTGGDAADVECPVFHVEAKHGAATSSSCSPRAAIRQAVRDAAKGKMPIAVTKANREAPLVTMLLDDWLELVGEWWEARQR